jgi:hypothetical protein
MKLNKKIENNKDSDYDFEITEWSLFFLRREK